MEFNFLCLECISPQGLNCNGEGAQQRRGIYPMLFQCWPTVFDAGPTLKQHWVSATSLLGWPRRDGAVSRATLSVPQPLRRPCRSPSRWNDPVGPPAAGAILPVP